MDPQVIPRRFIAIERTLMKTVAGIVVHQTDSSTEQATFSNYVKGGNGAHFLIAKDGKIYQTASLNHRTNHVGPIKARCIAEQKCQPAELIKLKKMLPTAMNRVEMKKAIPARYPSNQDSIGIEIVSKAALPAGVKMPPSFSKEQRDLFMGKNAVYETVNPAQQMSLQWLIDQLTASLHIPKTEIHRHPDVSRKNLTEASTAKWK